MTKFPSLTVRAERDADQRATVPQVFLSIDQVMDGTWAIGRPCGSEDPELFHDPGAMAVAYAQNICAGCSHLQPCRDYRYATGASGVWAGVYYADSSAGVQNARKKCALQRCTNGVRTNNPYCSFACEHKSKAGTRAGYDLHLKAAQLAREAGVSLADDLRMCGSCRDAKNADRSQRPSASGAKQRRSSVTVS